MKIGLDRLPRSRYILRVLKAFATLRTELRQGAGGIVLSTETAGEQTGVQTDFAPDDRYFSRLRRSFGSSSVALGFGPLEMSLDGLSERQADDLARRFRPFVVETAARPDVHIVLYPAGVDRFLNTRRDRLLHPRARRTAAACFGCRAGWRGPSFLRPFGAWQDDRDPSVPRGRRPERRPVAYRQERRRLRSGRESVRDGPPPGARQPRLVPDRLAQQSGPEPRGEARASHRCARTGRGVGEPSVRDAGDAAVRPGAGGDRSAARDRSGVPPVVPQGPVVLDGHRGDGAMTDLAMVPRKNPNSAYRIYDGQATIVLPEQAEVNVLNEIGSLVWDHIDGTRTVAQLIDEVVEQCDTTPEVARRDVLEFLQSLRAHGMVI